MGFDFNKIVTVLANEDNIKRGEVALRALHKCAEHVLHRSHEAALIIDDMRGGKLSTPMGVAGVLFPKIPMIVERANKDLAVIDEEEQKKD
jgi:hypothetical protein